MLGKLASIKNHCFKFFKINFKIKKIKFLNNSVIVAKILSEGGVTLQILKACFK